MVIVERDGYDEERGVSEYAAAEQRGEVTRKKNVYGIAAEQTGYAPGHSLQHLPSVGVSSFRSFLKDVNRASLYQNILDTSLNFV